MIEEKANSDLENNYARVFRVDVKNFKEIFIC